MRILFLLFLAVLVVSCCEQPKEVKNTITIPASDSALLPTSVFVYNEFLFTNTLKPEWVKNFNVTETVALIIEKAKKGEFVVYDPSDDFKLIKLDPAKIDSRFPEGKISMNIIQSLFFKEEWFFDTVKFKMEKKVLTWSPVMMNKREDGSFTRKKVFNVLNGEITGEADLLCADIITEFCLDDTMGYGWLAEFNREKFVACITSKVFSGGIKVYDPNDVTREFSMEELMANFDAAPETTLVEDVNTTEMVKKVVAPELISSEILSVIFIEDWYWDPETLAIKKEVKAIAPVRHIMKFDESGGMTFVKKIAYVIYFNEKHTPIL